MSSERLVDQLVSGLAPVRRRNLRADFLLMALLGAVELTMLLMAGAERADMHRAMRLPSFWWKLLSFGTFAIVATATALRSFHPAISPGAGLRRLAGLVALAFAVGCGIDALGEGGQALAGRLMWRDGLHCIVAVMVLAVPAVVALGLLMRRGAPTDRPGSATAVGVAGATWGAFLFVFSCPHDDPLYVAVWYGLGCVLVAALARGLLPVVARW